MSRRPTVFVLEVHTKAALPVVESMAAHGRHVVGGSWRRRCAGYYSRSVHERVRYPRPETAPEAFVAWLLDFLAPREVDVLLPVGDRMTALVAENQDAVRAHARVALPPWEVFCHGRSKILTLQAAARAGVPIPETWYPHDEGLDAVAEAARYPCLVKPAVSAGARGMVKVAGPEELRATFPRIVDEFGDSFVQDFVPQTGMQYKVDTVLGDGGRVLAGAVYNKIRYYPPTGGSSVLNKTVHRPDILDAAVRVQHEIGWWGFCDFDFITDPRDGVVKLMEINPRLPESFRATCAAGLDMAEMVYQLACGHEPEPQLETRTGRYLRFLPGDVLWLLTAKDRWRHLGSWLDFLNPKVTYQLTSLHDPGPILGYVLENLEVLLSPSERRARLRLGQAQSRPRDA